MIGPVVVARIFITLFGTILPMCVQRRRRKIISQAICGACLRLRVRHHLHHDRRHGDKGNAKDHKWKHDLVSMGNMFSHPIKKAMHRCDRMSPEELLGGIAGSIVPSHARGGGGGSGGGGGGSEGGGSAHNANEKNGRWRKTVLHSINVKKECRRGDVRRREREREKREE